MEPFKNLICDFGKQLNAKDIEADEQGYIALRCDSHVVHLQYDEEQDEVVVFTRLVEIEPKRLTEICLMLLGANILWQGTKGATFSIEPTSQMVLLADRMALSLFNANTLYSWLEQFLNIARYWNERLLTANAGGSLVPASDNANRYFSKNMIGIQ